MENKITRFEIIDHTSNGEGRAFIKRNDSPMEVDISVQNSGKTMKIFLSTPKTGYEASDIVLDDVTNWNLDSVFNKPKEK